MSLRSVTSKHFLATKSCLRDAAADLARTRHEQTSPEQERAVVCFSDLGNPEDFNVWRAIALLKGFGFEAVRVSFDEAVEVRLVRPTVKNGKIVEVPHYRMIPVRHGMGEVRRFLDEARSDSALYYAAPKNVVDEQDHRQGQRESVEA